jgi:hypothetical protein
MSLNVLTTIYTFEKCVTRVRGEIFNDKFNFKTRKLVVRTFACAERSCAYFTQAISSIVLEGKAFL